jgi:hypothetical protein
LGPGVYSDREAAAHVGETVTVVGTVISVHRTKGGHIFINFGSDYPHQTFSGRCSRHGGAGLADWIRWWGGR